MIIELLERRQLASVSYVKVGREIQPNILAGIPSYFSSNLPAGDYLIAVVGGSLTYSTYVKPIVYQVNDYDTGDYGFKVVEPGLPRFDAPGLSVARRSSKIAAAESVGVYLKFHHSNAGKIGIELYDSPFNDNLAGADGSPVFVLKKRVAASSPATAAPDAAVATGSSPALFSTTPIANAWLDSDTTLQDQADSLG